MPSRWLFESRPFLLEPCPFLCAMVQPQSWSRLPGGTSVGRDLRLRGGTCLLFLFDLGLGAFGGGYCTTPGAVNPLGRRNEFHVARVDRIAVAAAAEVELQRLVLRHRRQAGRRAVDL